MNPIVPQRRILMYLLVFYYLAAAAQPGELKFITYTTNDGLLHNFTKKCIEDQKGFIWVVSETGVSRFDGVLFKNFQHDDADPASLPHNTVHDIAIDEDGRIWFATGKGLCFYSDRINAFTSVDISGTFKNLPAVLSLAYDQRNNVVWFVTDIALYRFDLQTFKWRLTACENPSSKIIYQTYVSSDNRVWIALYRSGFMLYDISNDTSTRELEHNWVMNFYEGHHQTMWIGHWHSAHLGAWNMITGEFRDWSIQDEVGVNRNMIITGITTSPFSPDTILLLSTLHMGIRTFSVSQEKFIGGYSRDMFAKNSLPSDFTNYIFRDSRDIVWVCTWNGFSKINMLEQQFRTTEIPFLNTPMFQYYNLIEGIVQAEPGAWWIAVNGCGLIKYDTARKEILQQYLSDFSQQNIETKPGVWTDFLIKTPDGKSWAGNDLGLLEIDGNKITQHDIIVNGMHLWKKTLAIAPDKVFWISAENYLIHFNPVSKNYKYYPLDSAHQYSDPPTSMQSGFCSDGLLYTGTAKGLFQFNTTNHTSTRIPLKVAEADSIDLNTIHSLITDQHETIYMGTPIGLCLYNIRTGDVQLKGRKEGVYPIRGKSMLRDRNGNIWIYTPHTFFKYNTADETFTSFTTADGIHNFSSDPVNLFEFNGNFYITYRGAYTEFDPLKVDVNQAKVIPRITEVHIDRKARQLDIDQFSISTLSLTPKENDIAFQFTGIDFTNSERITFSYKLNDDGEWHESLTNRTATYTNLGPGEYTFYVRASNSSGILNETPAVFRFQITPTLIQRWWFWPLAGILFIAVVIWFANKRIRKIRDEELLKTKTNKMLAELETKLLRSQMNPHFIFNSLNSIQKYIWENKEEDAAEYLARFAKLIRAILENSRKEFISLYEEIEVLKLYIELEHRRSNGKFDYNMRISEDIEMNEVFVPPLLLQPYVENAIWHGVNKKAGHGNISIDVSKKEDLLVVTIDDDGVGRNFNQAQQTTGIGKQTSMGAEITLQRIQHLQTKSSIGGVRFIDKVAEGQPAGTTVVITIPVKKREHA